jgi:hypothetical protein
MNGFENNEFLKRSQTRLQSIKLEEDRKISKKEGKKD